MHAYTSAAVPFFSILYNVLSASAHALWLKLVSFDVPYLEQSDAADYLELSLSLVFANSVTLLESTPLLASHGAGMPRNQTPSLLLL